MAALQVVERGGSIGVHDSLPFASRGRTSYLGHTVTYVVTVRPRVPLLGSRSQKISPSTYFLLQSMVLNSGI